MKPNQLVDQMVNDAKVEPTPKPTIPEKPKDSVGYKSPKLKVTEEKAKEVPNEINVKKVYIDGNSKEGGK